MLLSINICKNAKKNSLFNLKLSFRAVGLCWPSFRHPPGPEDRELHECCENFLFWIRSVKWFIDSPVIKSTMIYGDLLAFSVFSGGLRWQRCRLPHGLSAETCWHEGQQTRNESHALRCDGKMNLSFFFLFSHKTMFYFVSPSRRLSISLTASSEERRCSAEFSGKTCAHWRCLKVQFPPNTLVLPFKTQSDQELLAPFVKAGWKVLFVVHLVSHIERTREK